MEMVAYFLEGNQKIIPNKRHNDPRDFVQIFLFLLRIKSVETDLLISLNYPDKVSQGVSQQAGESDLFKNQIAD